MKQDTWPIIKNAFFTGMPFPLKHIVPFIAKKGVEKSFAYHGMGKHDDAEIMQIARHTLCSLSELLSDKTYFLDNRLTTLDATTFAFLAQLILVSIDNPINKEARKYGNLVRYCNHISDQYFS